MTPNWLVRLNDFLTFLNPALGLVAGALAFMVVAAAADRLAMKPAVPAAPMAQIVRQPAPAACAQSALPAEWRELSRYD
jgi:hypothetical protein